MSSVLGEYEKLVDRVSNKNYKAFCKVCRQGFSVKQNGKEKVKQHENSAKHQKAVKSRKVRQHLVLVRLVA